MLIWINGYPLVFELEGKEHCEKTAIRIIELMKTPNIIHVCIPRNDKFDK